MQAFYTTAYTDDSVTRRLLDLELLLVRSPADLSALFSFAQKLVIICRQLSPPEAHPHYGYSLDYLAGLYHRIHQNEKAIMLYEQGLAVKKKALGEEHLNCVNSLNNLSVLYGLTGKHASALLYGRQALKITKAQPGEDQVDYLVSLANLASRYIGAGQYENAQTLLDQADLAIKNAEGAEGKRDATDLRSLASALRKLADGYYTTGLYDKALPLYQQALKVKKRADGETEDYAYSLSDLGIFYETIMGDFPKALSLYQQASAIQRNLPEGEQRTAYAWRLFDEGVIHRKLKHYKEALSLFQQALAVLQKAPGNHRLDSANICGSMAYLFMETGEYAKALPLLEQKLAVEKNRWGEDRPATAGTLHWLGILFQKMNRYDKALPLLEQAAAITKKTLGEKHLTYVDKLISMASLYTALNNPDRASALLIQASVLTQQILSRINQSLSEQEKMTFLTYRGILFSYLPSLLFTGQADLPLAQRQVYADQLTLKGLVLENQKIILNSIRRSGDSGALRLYEQWQASKTVLGKQLLLPVNQRLPALDSLQKATNELEQELSRSSATFRRQQQSRSVTVNDIRHKLAAGEAAIEFVRFPLYQNKWSDSVMYAALMLLPDDSTPRFVPLFEERQLNGWLGRFNAIADVDVYAAVERLYGSGSKGLGDSLYRLIWQPIDKYLGGVHTIYYAPAGLLHRIAFGALRAKDKQLLVDRYQLNQVLSTRQVALSSHVAKPATAGVWGNINYAGEGRAIAMRGKGPTMRPPGSAVSSFALYNEDTRGIRGAGWEPLPWTVQEMDSLRKTFTKARVAVTMQSRSLATEEAFKTLNGKSPEILHLATHAFFLPVAESGFKTKELAGGHTFTIQQNPLFRSGLVMAGGNPAWEGQQQAAEKEDGILTAYEITQMDLSQTKLVVLSACETALGDLQGNEGVIGLQRAFKMAGVKQLIVSLWSVPDSKAIVQMMTAFYRNWFSGQSTRLAFRNAQRQLKKTYPSPFFWAPFVLLE